MIDDIAADDVRFELELLYDLDADPHATENLIEERQAIADEMRAELNGWLVQQASSGWSRRRPQETRGRDPLAEMCTEGPFLSVDSDDLLALYRDFGRSDERIAAVE